MILPISDDLINEKTLTGVARHLCFPEVVTLSIKNSHHIQVHVFLSTFSTIVKWIDFLPILFLTYKKITEFDILIFVLYNLI